MLSRSWNGSWFLSPASSPDLHSRTMRAVRSWVGFDSWRLRRYRIGTRLRLVFACILLLMFVGASLSVGCLRAVRRDLDRGSVAEERLSAVIQVDTSVVAMLNQLHRAA